MRKSVVTMFKSPWFSHYKWLLIVVVLAFAVRLYKITNEPLDWHAFRQADTASVTREYVKHGIDLLVPHYQDLSNIQSGQDNLLGYRMVEFPLVNAIAAWLVINLGTPLVVTSRMVSVLFSLGTLVSLYFLVEKLSGKTTALLTAIIFGVLPYSVFYSRAILPEPAMLFFSTASLLAFHYWLEQKTVVRYVTVMITLVIALLIKPSIVFLFPVYFGLIFFKELPIKKWTVSFVLQKTFYYGVVLAPIFGVSAAVLLVWRKWIEQFPSGIPALDWLFNSNGIRLRPAWFRWLFWERLTKLISGYFGVALLPFNLISFKKEIVVYASWWFGILTYLIVIATGNVQHDYYQIIAVPIICISLARGAVLLHSLLSKRWGQQLAQVVVGGMLLGGLWLSWQHVSGYYNINHYEYMTAGQALDRVAPADALVIAPAFGDTQFLFQTNRRGWPIGFEIEDKIAKGATYYVNTSYDDEARRLEQEYTVVEKTDKYIIINLQQKKTP